jgi:hypothetical protein
MKQSYQPFILRFLVIGFTLCANTSFGATSEDSTSQADSILIEDSEEECYCSVRKRKQVERRLQKKESEQE